MGRIFTGKGPAPNSSGEWNLDRFCAHIRGRADATTEVLIGVAVLKKLGSVFANQAVAYSGAVYQDWRGTKMHPRAHRFPCNPTIGGQNLPDIRPKPKLEEALIEPLAITDFLTFEVNYVDERFEALGGKDAAVDAVQYVLLHQPQGQSVNIPMITHAVLNIALAGYQRAYALIESELVSRVNQENLKKMLERSANSKVKQRSPTLIIESIQEAAYDMHRFTNILQPTRLLPAGIQQYAQKLEQLA